MLPFKLFHDFANFGGFPPFFAIWLIQNMSTFQRTLHRNVLVRRNSFTS